MPSVAFRQELGEMCHECVYYMQKLLKGDIYAKQFRANTFCTVCECRASVQYRALQSQSQSQHFTITLQMLNIR